MNRLALFTACSSLVSSWVLACPTHSMLTAEEVAGIDRSNAALVHTHSAGADSLAGNNVIGAFKLNLTGATGHSPNATINSFVSLTQSDVQEVWFDASYIYVKHTGVPSHDIGRADGNNPAYARNLNRTSRLPRTPGVNGTTATGNGGIGVMVNGALLFNPGDAMSYNNANTWFRNALTFEGATFDIGPGHSAPQGGTPGNSTPGQYHYHIGPTALLNQIDAGNTGSRHSPIIGFAFDGYPIYGPYGYANPNDPSSAIKRLDTSYKVRDDLTALGAARNSLTEGGATLASNLRGPAVSATYPGGAFLQDYKYVAGLGDLNEYNMRFMVTPEYPQGTPAYVMTLDANGAWTYPYVVGPKYYGAVDTSNIGPTGGAVTIPAAATRLRAGDANLDGAVNFDDLLLLAQNYERSGVTLWTDGDFTSDTNVNFDDLLALAQNYSGSGLQSDWAMAQSLVPEPTSAAVGLFTFFVQRRRRGPYDGRRG